MKPHLEDIDAIEDQAAAWADTLRDNSDPVIQQAFDAWRNEDPAHVAAFERIDRAYAAARAVLSNPQQQLTAIENEILARAAADTRRGRLRIAYGMAASLMVAAIAVVTVTGGSWEELQYLKDRARYALAGDTLYRTAVGERLAVTLDDGSVLTLNTDSRALVQYQHGTRGVNLMRGQALFEVAKDPQHPFVVTAGNRKVTALGTAFDVRYTGEQLAVTLIEGRVAVESATASSATSERTELAPGDQLLAAASQAQPMVKRANVKRAISWRDGQVIFDNDPLQSAVAEINRYGKRTVVLTDERLNGMRVSGAFNTSDTGVFIDMLTVYLPVKVVQITEAEIVLGYRTN
jgi:transmembrane sensor